MREPGVNDEGLEQLVQHYPSSPNHIRIPTLASRSLSSEPANGSGKGARDDE